MEIVSSEPEFSIRHRRMVPAYSMSGQDARLASIHTTPGHDPRLVEVVGERLSLSGKTFNLVTPFSGKSFCLDDYFRGIDRLPISEAHYVVYDNSCDHEFSAELSEIVKKKFDSYILLVDHNPPSTIDVTDDALTVDARVWAVYKRLLNEEIADLPYTMIVEDDVEIPEGSYETLHALAESRDDLATVVGSMNNRRKCDNYPVLWHLRRTYQVGGNFQPETGVVRVVEEKEFGVEIIGSSHLGCWLTKTPVIKSLGVDRKHEGVHYVDQSWGLAVHNAGYKMAVDWSVKTKHYYLADGKKKYV